MAFVVDWICKLTQVCPASLPPGGVQVLDGGDGSLRACVADASQTAVGSLVRDVIAAQCCEAGGGCMRFVGTNDDEGCVAGHAKKGGVRPMTFAEAHARCSALGLQLCNTDCAGKGC